MIKILLSLLLYYQILLVYWVINLDNKITAMDNIQSVIYKDTTTLLFDKEEMKND